MELNERDIDLQKEAPTLAAVGKGIPFTVPEGYFDSLSENLISRVRIEVALDDKPSSFKVPGNYFEDLASRIEERIAVEKIRSLSSSEGFTVPEGYFAGLTDRITARIDDSEVRKPIIRSLFTSWMSYAAAACITAVIATGIYFTSNTYNLNKQLSDVPDQEILNYLQVYSTAGDTPFIIENLNPDQLETVTQDVSAEELELYINSTTL